ncbi:MAG: hypothetical protein C4314_04300, partial [Thermoflexus sp.]
AREIMAGLLVNSSAGPGEAGFYHVVICSSRAAQFDDIHERCLPQDDAGGPGDRVVILVRFNHPIITPLLRPIAPWIPLVARREVINERFRTVRIRELPPTLSLPTRTPTPVTP